MALIQSLRDKSGQFVKSALIPLLILATAVIVFVYFKNSKPVQAPVEIKQKVWPVKVISVAIDRISPLHSLYGSVESNAMVMVSAPLTGEVAEVTVKPGDEFKAGDLLIALDDADLTLPLRAAQADVADVQAQLDLEKLAFEANEQKLQNEQKVLEFKRTDVSRNSKLIQKDLTSQTTLDQSKEALVRQEFAVVNAKLAVQEHQIKLAQLKARLDKSKANLEQAKLNVQRGRVVAPFDGRVTQVKVSKGDRVAPGSVLLSYYGYNSLELKAKLPVFVMPSVYQSFASGYALHAHAQVAGMDVKLPLVRLAGESSSSGLDAYFKVPESLKITRPGDLMQVSLVGQPQEDVFAVPYSAIYGADSIYVVEDGVMKVKTVKNLGETQVNGEAYALLKDPSGSIKNGTQVVVTHLPNAISGLKVAVVQ